MSEHQQRRTRMKTGLISLSIILCAVGIGFIGHNESMVAFCVTVSSLFIAAWFWLGCLDWWASLADPELDAMAEAVMRRDPDWDEFEYLASFTGQASPEWLSRQAFRPPVQPVWLPPARLALFQPPPPEQVHPPIVG